MSSRIKIFYTTLLWVCFTLFLSNCWQKEEFDYKENHPLHQDHEYHNHDDKHSHDHHHHNSKKDDEFDKIIESLEDQRRVIWQKPGKVIDILGNIEGKVVADIGAGTGYFTFRLAHDAQKVIAIDIEPKFLAYIDSVKLKFPENIQNKIEVRLADVDNPKLNDKEVDIVILVNTYAYIENRIQYFKQLKEGLKSGAKLLIVDYKKRKIPEGQGPPDALKVSANEVETELEMAGYRLMETDDTTLEYQYIILVTNR